VGIFRKLAGHKTYLGAFGMLALGIFQIATGQILPGLHSLLMAAIAAGLRGAIGKMKF